MAATGAKVMQTLTMLAREQGWEVEEKHGSHRILTFKSPAGELFIFSATPEGREIQNNRTKLKRAGMVCDPSEWRRIKRDRAKAEQRANCVHPHWKAEAGFLVMGEINVTTTEGCTTCGELRDRTQEEIRVDHLMALKHLSKGRILTPEEIHVRERLEAEAEPVVDIRETLIVTEVVEVIPEPQVEEPEPLVVDVDPEVSMVLEEQDEIARMIAAARVAEQEQEHQDA